VSKPILSVKNLTKAFNKHLVINNVSFEVYEGEVLGLLGPTDSGKSAILRAISGALVPDNGDISINDISYKTNYTEAIKDVTGFINLPQLYLNYTGLQNMKILTSLRGKFNNDILRNVAKITGIESELDKKLSKFTKAEKQKLLLAISIASKPKLIVLDDPFVGLNVEEMKALQDLIKLLSSKYKISFILSSQMLGLMEQVCHSIAIINNGSILEIKNMDALRLESDKEQKLSFTVDYPNFAGKIILNEFNCKVQVCGNKILVYNTEQYLQKILERLKHYNISIFHFEIVKKPLEQLLEEVLQRKAMNKSWVEEYR